MLDVRLPALLALGLSVSSCALLLDFDELQEGGGAGAGTMGGGNGGNAGSAGSMTAGGGSGGSGGGAGSVSLASVSQTLAAAVCEKAQSCYGNAALELVFFDEDCTTTMQSLLENTFVANVQESVQAGTLEYDGSAVPGCLQEFAALDCEDVTIAFPEGCKQALSGLQPVGGACNHSLECDVGLYCDNKSCPGTCAAPLTEGTPCADGDTCADGLTCFQGACAALGHQGDECGADLWPGCLTGMLCVGDNKDMMMPGKCYETVALFSANTDQSCNFGGTPTLCVENNSCPVFQLVPKCVMKAPAGGPCELAVPDMCREGEYCNAGTCTPLPKAGEPCATGIIIKPACEAYSRCVNGTCIKLDNNGSSCTQPGECYSGKCAGSECVPPGCE